jgi:glutathione S-transferase
MPEARAIAKDQAAAQPDFKAYLAKAFAKT